MKKWLLLTVFFTLNACTENSSKAKSAHETRENNSGSNKENSTAWGNGSEAQQTIFSCQKSNDAFSCLELACQRAGGSYDNNLKVCDCGDGKIFSTNNTPSCLNPKLTSHDNNEVVYEFKHPKNTDLLYVSMETQQQEAFDNQNFIKTLPIAYTQGLTSIQILYPQNSAFVNDLRNKKFMSSIFSSQNLIGRPESNLPNKIGINQSISDKVLNRLMFIYFYPTQARLITTTGS